MYLELNRKLVDDKIMADNIKELHENNTSQINRALTIPEFNKISADIDNDLAKQKIKLDSLLFLVQYHTDPTGYKFGNAFIKDAYGVTGDDGKALLILEMMSPDEVAATNQKMADLYANDDGKDHEYTDDELEELDIPMVMTYAGLKTFVVDALNELGTKTVDTQLVIKVPIDLPIYGAEIATIELDGKQAHVAVPEQFSLNMQEDGSVLFVQL